MTPPTKSSYSSQLPSAYVAVVGAAMAPGLSNSDDCLRSDDAAYCLRGVVGGLANAAALEADDDAAAPENELANGSTVEGE